MPTKPRKPWRVILTGPVARVESEHASEKRAYDHLIAELRLAKKGERPHAEAKVMQWEGGRWWHFETVRAEDVPEESA
ncbi:hypothetical protein [Streptomyces sp. NPDC060027]|uniref:hypothetical protein n=1 Tax=Streptomyces sp. NPDC060027 TaxID=3347040 RepID=UPI00369FA4BC